MHYLKIIILILFFYASLLSADLKAFSEMAITIQLNRELNQTPFNQFWREGDGFSLIYQTPFYRGNITAGMAYTPYHGKTSDRPDYQSYFISLGWFYPFCLPFKFQYA